MNLYKYREKQKFHYWENNCAEEAVLLTKVEYNFNKRVAKYWMLIGFKRHMYEIIKVII